MRRRRSRVGRLRWLGLLVFLAWFGFGFGFSEDNFSEQAVSEAVGDVGAVVPRLETFALENSVSVAESGHAELNECFHGLRWANMEMQASTHMVSSSPFIVSDYPSRRENCNVNLHLRGAMPDSTRGKRGSIRYRIRSGTSF